MREPQFARTRAQRRRDPKVLQTPKADKSTGELVWLTAVAADADNFRIASMRPDDREAPLTFYFAHQYCMIRAAPGRVYGRSHSAFFNITFASEGESHE